MDLLLIKHSLPEIDPARQAALWRLSEEGREKCVLLAHALPFTVDIFLSSHEPKAQETARILAEHHKKACHVLPGLHEHERSSVPLLPRSEFESLVKQLFSNPDRLIIGDETAEQACRRFEAAVAAALANHPGKRIAIVSHGTVISLYAGRGTSDKGYNLWRRLGLPSFIVLRMPERHIVQLVEQIGE